ncbi:MAG TPA: response regulator transcription factor [Candidatus Acidoferrales bacterium]|nr:response regulator transcription factor [Candidatus Acidoferrales bacterium]
MNAKLLVHCSDPNLARALEAALRKVGDFSLIPSRGNASALRERVTASTPDVVLLELTPDITFEFLSEMKRVTQSKLVLWVNSISTALAFQCMSLGIRGILRKTLSPKLQAECLRKVAMGEVWFERVIVEDVAAANGTALTYRERQILRLLSQGLKNSEIATTLAVSEGTVKVYLTRLFQKVGAKDRFELALFGLKNAVGGQWNAETITQQTCATS